MLGLGLAEVLCFLLLLLIIIPMDPSVLRCTCRLHPSRRRHISACQSCHCGDTLGRN